MFSQKIFPGKFATRLSPKSIFNFACVVALMLNISSCIQIDEFEKSAQIPSQEWQYQYTPEFKFNISDTTSLYNLFITLRHTDKYNFNNIWLRVGLDRPGDSTLFQNVNLSLATDAKGWEGTGLNDIYEVRKLISRGPVAFARPGTYSISIAQIMRENPLQYVLSVGVRIEKAGNH